MSHRILTIEDESAVRKSFVMFLEDNDFEVIEAEDGEVGIEKIKAESPDLILVDLRMPRVDGLTVLDFVGTNYPHIPVIAVSGTGNITDVIDALHLGAWDYILKPVEDLNMLLYAVRRALEKVRLERENEQYRIHLEEEVEKKTADLLESNKKLQQFNDDLQNKQTQLTKSIEEKEVLLREIHHRVKNNMQVIMSLMNLQKPSYQNDYDQKLLEKSIKRIQAMALAHDQLYRNSDLSKIDLSSYIEGIIQEILYSSVSVGTNIDVKTQIDSIYLGMEYVIPLGLIVHELVSNAIEHAFPEQNEGKIELSADCAETVYTLRVWDNGIGLPDSIDLERAESLGFLLVQTLAAQIHGNLSVSRDTGTSFILEFTCPQ